jgi:Ni,Fe-hydrogenase III large subunit
MEEPYKISVTCQGETIHDVAIDIGFSFRAIELLAQRRNYVQDLVLVERVCGICSGVHTMTFAMAAEALLELDVPARAQYIRVIISELERLHSHLLWAGIAAEDIGFQTMFMEIFALRERVMDALEAISGNRVHYAMNCIGGVNNDITDPDGLLAAMRDIKQALEQVVMPVFTRNPTVRARMIGVGMLTKEQAVAYGVVGPFARASGLDADIRSEHPVYQALGFKTVVEHGGDVFARVLVRAFEMLESARLIEQALHNLPAGPLCAPGGPFTVVPEGEVTVRSEAPRGELLYYLQGNGTDHPARVKIRTPSYVNIPAVEPMALGQQLGDLPLIQASLDPCCSCTDR